MKTAVLSDIHGNMQALNAVMEDLKSFGCEKVFCLGDIAMAGPQPKMAIDYVKSRNNWTVIQGNTDKLIAEFSAKIMDDLKHKFPVMANALADDVTLIDDEGKNYLKSLPQQCLLEEEKVKILLVHGSPRRNNEDILPDMPLGVIDEMTEGVDADVIFCGHTHIPCGYQTNKKLTIVNVGSVGRPMTEDAKACYVIADFQNGGFSIEHKFVDYDRAEAAQILKSRGFEGCDIIADMILNPKQRHA